MYPTLEQLVSDGLVRQDKQKDGKLYALTPAGEAYVTSHHDNIAARCGAFTSSQGAGLSELRRAAAQLMVAVFQIAQAGTAAQRTLAGKLLAQTRRGLYRILAEGGDDADGEEQP